MMIRWMIYLGLLIFAAYESVVFEDAAVTMFFVAALLLFVLLLLLLLIQRQMLKVSMKIPVPAAEKNKGVQLFRLENRLPFLIGEYSCGNYLFIPFYRKEREVCRKF
ncbi:MAG: hypothetical protein ACLS2X_01515 [Coprococcus sp.]